MKKFSNFLILPGRINTETFSAIKCVIGALFIGALLTLFMILCDRAEAKRIDRKYQEEFRHAR